MKTPGKTLLILLLAVAALIRLADFTRPFDNGLRGECGAGYSISAENLLLYGPFTTGLIPVMNTLPVDREHLVYYEHHPPGMVALTAAVFALAGSTGEAAARSLPILLSLLAMIILWCWVRNLSGLPMAFTAAALTATVPLSAYYGPFLNFETFVIPPVLLAVYGYMKWAKEGEPRWLAGSLIFMGVGTLMDWTALIAAMLIFLDGLLFLRRGRNDKATSENAGKPAKGRIKFVLLYPVLGIVLFFAVRLWFLLQNRRFGTPSVEGADELLYLLRVTPLDPDFSFGLFLENIGGYLTSLLTWPVLIAAAAGLIWLIVEWIRRRALSMGGRSILILFLWGLLNLVIFASHATKHDYWIILLYPALVWCAALLLVRLADFLGGRVQPWKAHLVLALLATGLAAFAASRTHALTVEKRGMEEYYHRGLAYADLAKDGELILTPEREPIQVIRYSGGAVFLFPIPTPEDLTRNLPLFEKYGYKDRKKIFVIPQSEVERLRSTREAFEKIAPVEIRGAFLIFHLDV